MPADGTTSCPRCDLVETAGLDVKREIQDDPRKVGSDAETTAQIFRSFSKGNGGNMYIDHHCQGCHNASTASASDSGIGDIK